MSGYVRCECCNDEVCSCGRTETEVYARNVNALYAARNRAVGRPAGVLFMHCHQEGWTACVLKLNGTLLDAFGVALCSPLDTFSRARGRGIAFRRALAQIEDKAIRKWAGAEIIRHGVKLA